MTQRTKLQIFIGITVFQFLLFFMLNNVTLQGVTTDSVIHNVNEGYPQTQGWLMKLLSNIVFDYVLPSLPVQFVTNVTALPSFAVGILGLLTTIWIFLAIQIAMDTISPNRSTN